MNPLSGVLGIAYLVAYGFAIYERIPVSDWLISQLPLYPPPLRQHPGGIDSKQSGQQ
jgi:hypothetical protein